MQFFKNKTYIIIAIWTIIILSLVLLIIWPLLSEIKSNSEELLSGKNDAVILRAQSDQIENFKKAYDDYKSNLEKINKLFVDPQNPVNFIKFLEDTASASSIESKISLVPVAPQKDQSMGIVAFQLSSSDDFLKILHFSEKLENGPYLIEIQSVSIKNADTDTSAKNYPSGKVDAVFLINAFILPN